VDFAVMEKAQNVWVIPADFPWDDVGSWDSLQRTLSSDSAGNVVQGAAALIDTEGCIVVNDSPEIKVGVLGLEGVIVVATEGAVLVCAKDQAQRVREITAALQAGKTQ
jgi:mannose-1-phosphate guanylyltransferase